MPFAESLKRRVRRRAGFRCCVCDKRSLALEVHHIHPEGDGGSNEEDNAAPLCPLCHSLYGDNPHMRTRIREMRNYLYDSVAQIAFMPGLLQRVESLETAVQDMSALTESQDLDRTIADAADRPLLDFEASQLRAISDMGFYYQSSSQPGTPDAIVDVGGRQVAVEFKSAPWPSNPSIAATTASVMSDFVSASGSVAGLIVYPRGRHASSEATAWSPVCG